MTPEPGEKDRPAEPTTKHLGGWLFSIAVLFCGMEMTPGWGIFGFDWPWSVYYTIALISGAFAGSREVQLRWAGAVGGAVAGAGSLLVLSAVLHETQNISRIMLLAAMAIGMLPGFALYYFLKEIARFSNRHSSPANGSEPTWMGESAARRRRLFIIIAVLGMGSSILYWLLNR